MEIMDQLGFTAEIESLIQSKIDSLKVITDTTNLKLVRFDRLKSACPYVSLIPQMAWLDFMASKARAFDHVERLMNANALHFIEEGG